jgi:hypothetical protein
MISDLGTYEILLPNHINHQKFETDASMGIGRFWLVCTSSCGMHRFTGVIYPNTPEKQWVRIKLDIGSDFCCVTTPWGQDMTPLEVAKLTRDVLGGTKIFKDGIEVIE